METGAGTLNVACEGLKDDALPLEGLWPLVTLVLLLRLLLCGNWIETTGAVLSPTLDPTVAFATCAETVDEALPTVDGVEHRKEVRERDLGRTPGLFLRGRPGRLRVTVSLAVLVHGLGFWTLCLPVGQKKNKDRNHFICVLSFAL